MKFSERSYNSDIFRPRPEILWKPESRLLIVATAWGAPSGAKKVIETIEDYLLVSTSDEEVTTPFKKLSCLSPAANALRTATMLANDRVYREENRQEYSTGVELFAACVVEQELAFVQVGQPNLLIAHPGDIPQPLAIQADMNLDAHLLTTPLASQILGPDDSCNISIHSIRPKAGDKLILVSRSGLPGQLFSQSAANCNLKSVSELLVRDNEKKPFWLGLLEI